MHRYMCRCIPGTVLAIHFRRMKQLTYPCRYPEARPLGKGVSAVYRDDVLEVFTTKGKKLRSGITAYKGDTIIITVLDRMIVCDIKETAHGSGTSTGSK